MIENPKLAVIRTMEDFSLVLSSKARPDLEAEAIERFQSLNIAGAIVAPLGRADG